MARERYIARATQHVVPSQSPYDNPATKHWAKTVTDAEMLSATVALYATLSARQDSENMIILLDNQVAVWALRIGKSSSLIRRTRVFHNVARKTKLEVRLIPGHSQFPGNEEVDAEARAALQNLPSRQAVSESIPPAYQCRFIHQRRQDLVNDW